jgi:hypothetical protein
MIPGADWPSSNGFSASRIRVQPGRAEGWSMKASELGPLRENPLAAFSRLPSQ